jgi:hypothetical protein
VLGEGAPPNMMYAEAKHDHLEGFSLLSAGLAPGGQYVPAKVEVTQVGLGVAEGFEVFKHVPQLFANSLIIVSTIVTFFELNIVTLFEVVLLNCTNQLVMHILNARLRSIVEKAGILEPGQSGGRQGRSTDINLTKLEWVTREALTQGKRVYRVDVDFTNAFNAMSQAALWAVMRAYGIPDVDLLMSLYEHSTVRMAPNDPQCATITFDTGVAQGSALSPLLFLIFMNALLGLITDRGQKLRISHGLKCGVQLRRKEATPNRT